MEKHVPVSVVYFINCLKREVSEYDLRMGCIYCLPSTATYEKWCIEVGEFNWADCPDYHYEIRRNKNTGVFQWREWKNYSRIWDDPKWSKWETI